MTEIPPTGSSSFNPSQGGFSEKPSAEDEKARQVAQEYFTSPTTRLYEKKQDRGVRPYLSPGSKFQKDMDEIRSASQASKTALKKHADALSSKAEGLLSEVGDSNLRLKIRILSGKLKIFDLGKSAIKEAEFKMLCEAYKEYLSALGTSSVSESLCFKEFNGLIDSLLKISQEVSKLDNLSEGSIRHQAGSNPAQAHKEMKFLLEKARALKESLERTPDEREKCTPWEYFDPLHHLSFAVKERREIMSSISDSNWIRSFERLEQDLERLVNKNDFSEENINYFISKHGNYKINKEGFLNSKNPINKKLHKEKILRSILYEYKNDVELRSFIESNKSGIIAEFGPPDQEVAGFDIEYTKGETHNGGKKPAKITFKGLEGEALFSVMYKPRAAEIDLKIQGLLKDLKMPSCKILSYSGENKSIWRFIEGTDMILKPSTDISQQEKVRFSRFKRSMGPAGESPEAFIQHSSAIPTDQKGPLRQQLQKLDAVLGAIHVSDLHGGNVRLGGDGQIYAIDLEVLDHRQQTLLMMSHYGDQSPPASSAEGLLSAAEQHLVRDFISSIEGQRGKLEIVTRHVLLKTGDLFGAINNPNIVQAQGIIKQQISRAMLSRGYSCTDSEIISRQVYIDILNGDVPFFTELEGIMYYGSPEKGLEIGKKNST